MRSRLLFFGVLFALSFVVYVLSAQFGWLPSGTKLLRFSVVQPINKNVVVEKSRSIGELTTAQFYGEVFADVHEVYMDILLVGDLEKGTNLLSDFPKLRAYERYFLPYFVADTTFKGLKIKLKEQIRVVAHWQNEHEQNIGQYINNENKQRAILNITAQKATLERLKILVSKTKKKLERKKLAWFTFKKRQNLIFIGRGRVKAGFDFQKLTEQFVDISNKSDTLRVSLPQAKVLNADINPWFVRDKVPGYELFDSHGGSFTDAEEQAVKKKCIEKLLKQALDRGILEQANESGRLHLLKLFGALGHSEIDVQLLNKQ